MIQARLLNGIAKGSTDQNNVTTAAVDMTGASLLVAVVASSSAHATTLSDSSSNTWTAMTAVTLSDARVQIFYVQNPTVTSSMTFTVSSTTAVPSVSVGGFSFIPSSPEDNHAGASSAGAITIQPGSITPSQNNSLLILGANINAAWDAQGITKGFAVAAQQRGVSTQCYGSMLAYALQDTAAAVNPTITWQASAASVAEIVSFKTTPASSGSGGAWAYA